MALWLVVWTSSSVVLDNLVQNIEIDDIDKQFSPSLVDYDTHYISRIEKKMKGKIDDYHYILKKYASSDVDTYSDQSKLAYVLQKIAVSHLPQYLKDTIPFVPFQESWYRLSLESKTGAKWPWQFMKSTGRLYGLVTWFWENEKDYRTDMKKSTKAAIKYFAHLYDILKHDSHYKSLEKKYHLHEEDFLLPVTINAYNSGPEHMQHAFKIIDTESSLQQDIQKAAEHRRWLFVYLTTKYIEQWDIYQKPYFSKPYYYKESADYVYNIESFKYIKNKWLFEICKSRSPHCVVSDQSLQSQPDIHTASLATWYHVLLGATTSALIYLLGKKAQKWTSTLSRKEFLSTWVVAASGSLAAATYGWYDNLPWDDLNEKMWYIFGKNELAKLSYDEVISPGLRSVFMDIYYKAIDIARDDRNDRVVTTLMKRSLQDIMRLNYYPSFQYLGDAAFVLYKQNADNTYLQMAQYFYNRAWNIAEKQRKNPLKYTLPQKWDVKLQERLLYCKKALDMIDVEFAK